MTESEYRAFNRYLRSQRTLTEDQVRENDREHDRDDFTPDELLAPYGA